MNGRKNAGDLLSQVSGVALLLRMGGLSLVISAHGGLRDGHSDEVGGITALLGRFQTPVILCMHLGWGGHNAFQF